MSLEKIQNSLQDNLTKSLEIISNQLKMEDLKSQDTNLAKEMTKIKAMQGKLAKKLGEQEKDKATGPKQKTKFTKIFINVMFIAFFGLLLIANSRGYERKLEKSDQVIGNLTKIIEVLLMERTKLEASHSEKC